MRRFRFRLQGLLRVCVLREREARCSLAHLLRALEEAHHAHQEAQRALKEAEERLRTADRADRLRIASAHLEAARREVLEAQKRRVDLQQRVEAAWARFLQVRRRRQVVERLRDRRLRQHREEEGRREQMQLDDIATTRRSKDR